MESTTTTTTITPPDSPPETGNRHGVPLYLQNAWSSLESARYCHGIADAGMKDHLLSGAERDYTRLLEGIEDLKRAAGELGRAIIAERGGSTVPVVAEAATDDADPDYSDLM